MPVMVMMPMKKGKEKRKTKARPLDTLGSITYRAQGLSSSPKALRDHRLPPHSSSGSGSCGRRWCCSSAADDAGEEDEGEEEEVSGISLVARCAKAHTSVRKHPSPSQGGVRCDAGDGDDAADEGERDEDVVVVAE